MSEKVKVLRRQLCPACLSFVSPSDRPDIAKWYCPNCNKYRSAMEIELARVNNYPLPSRRRPMTETKVVHEWSGKTLFMDGTMETTVNGRPFYRDCCADTDVLEEMANLVARLTYVGNRLRQETARVKDLETMDRYAREVSLRAENKRLREMLGVINGSRLANLAARARGVSDALYRLAEGELPREWEPTDD